MGSVNVNGIPGIDPSSYDKTIKAAYPVAEGDSVAAGDVVDITGGKIGKTITDMGMIQIPANGSWHWRPFVFPTADPDVMILVGTASNGIAAQTIKVVPGSGELTVENYTVLTSLVFSYIYNVYQVNSTTFLVYGDKNASSGFALLVRYNGKTLSMIGNGYTVPFSNFYRNSSKMLPLSDDSNETRFLIHGTTVVNSDFAGFAGALVEVTESGITELKTFSSQPYICGRNTFETFPAYLRIKDGVDGSKRFLVWGWINGASSGTFTSNGHGYMVITLAADGSKLTYSDFTRVFEESGASGKYRNYSNVAICYHGKIYAAFTFSSSVYLYTSEDDGNPPSFTNLVSGVSNPGHGTNDLFEWDGELYLATFARGRLYRLKAEETQFVLVVESLVNANYACYFTPLPRRDGYLSIFYETDPNINTNVFPNRYQIYHTEVQNVRGTLYGHRRDISCQAIALRNGTGGQEVEVVFEGVVELPGIVAGTEITSPGVRGYAPVDGTLVVTVHWNETQVVTGAYTLNPNTTQLEIFLGFRPKLVMLYDKINNHISSASSPQISMFPMIGTEEYTGGFLTVTDTGFLSKVMFTNGPFYYIAMR